MFIQDGTGSGQLAKVNDQNRLAVSASIFPKASLVARESAGTYTWTSSYSATSGDEIIYIKNTSKTQDLVLHHIICGCVNTATFGVFQVTGTASGTTITGTNTNLTSSLDADATSYGDAAVTGLTIGDRVHFRRVGANDSKAIDTQDAVILGLNDAIAVTYTGSTGVADIEIMGYYKNKD